MTKQFTKGQRVAVIADWDRKGTVYIRRAVVHSSGAKVTRLLDTNGEMFKVAFSSTSPIYPDASDAELEAAALAKAASILEEERAHFARCLEGSHREAYNRAIRRDIEALHEPRVLWR